MNEPLNLYSVGSVCFSLISMGLVTTPLTGLSAPPVVGRAFSSCLRNGLRMILIGILFNAPRSVPPQSAQPEILLSSGLMFVQCITYTDPALPSNQCCRSEVECGDAMLCSMYCCSNRINGPASPLAQAFALSMTRPKKPEGTAIGDSLIPEGWQVRFVRQISICPADFNLLLKSHGSERSARRCPVLLVCSCSQRHHQTARVCPRQPVQRGYAGRRIE